MQTKSLTIIVLMLILTSASGYSLGHYFGNYSDNDNDNDLFTQIPTTPTTADITMTVEDAELQRVGHYQNINSIAEILSLPSLFAQQEALYAITGRANRIQVQQLLSEATGIANINQQNTLMHILFSRLVEIDPQAAVTIALDAPQYHVLLTDVFQNWAKLDIEAAIESANNINNPSQQSTAAHGILAAIDTSDITTISEVSKRLKADSNESQLIGRAIVELATNNPESAFQQALDMENAYERQFTLRSIVDTWAATNPREAFTNIEHISDTRIRKQLLEAVLYRWAEKDPQAAYEVMLTLPNAARPSSVSYSIFNNLAYRNPKQALNNIENITSSRERVEAYSATLSTWAQTDALAAATYVAQLDNKQLKQQLAPAVIQHLSTQSPDEALAFAKELDPSGQLNLQNTVIAQIATNNPERALQIAQNSEQPTLRQQFIVTVVDNLAYSDPARAASMIDQLPSTDQNENVINSVVYNWANSDPEAAIAWVNTKSEALKEAGLTSIGSQLASLNPDLAASYLPQLSGQIRENWVQNITYTYSSYNIEEAVTWIENFRNEPIFGALLSSVASVAVNSDVDYALELAQSMPSIEERIGLIRQIADQLSYSDPQRAQQLYARLPAENRPEEEANKID